MAAKRSTRKKKATRKSPARKAGGTARSRRAAAVARIEQELPPTLRQYSKRVRVGLTRLERKIEKAEARTRRTTARALRDLSHQLGRFEAEGERRWRRLTSRARREALLRLKQEAMQGGFHAVINVRLETSRLANARGGEGVAGVEVLAFGTGLKLSQQPV